MCSPLVRQIRIGAAGLSGRPGRAATASASEWKSPLGSPFGATVTTQQQAHACGCGGRQSETMLAPPSPVIAASCA